MIPYCILVIEDDDDRAFMENLYLSYHRMMYKRIYEYTKDSKTAEDVLQSVLEKLIDKITLLRSLDRDHLVGYISSACRNTAHNFTVRSAKEIPFADITPQDKAETWQSPHAAEVLVLRQEDITQLRRIWPKLDEQSQLLLEGYYILDKPMHELGKELGIKPSSVRMYLTRARRKAAALLQAELEPIS